MGSKISPTLLDDLEKKKRSGRLEGIKRLHRGWQFKSWGVQAGHSKHLLCQVWWEVVAMESQRHSKRVAPTTTRLTFSHAPCQPFIIRQKRSCSVNYLNSNTRKIWFIYCWMIFVCNNWPNAKGFRCSSQCDIKIDPIYFLSTRVKTDI